MMEIFLRFFVVMLPIHHGGLVHFLLLLLSSGARWLVTVADVPSWRRRRRSRQWCHNGRLIILSFFFLKNISADARGRIGAGQTS